MFVSLFLKPCTASAGDRCFVALQAPPNRAPVRVSIAEITQCARQACAMVLGCRRRKWEWRQRLLGSATFAINNDAAVAASLARVAMLDLRLTSVKWLTRSGGLPAPFRPPPSLAQSRSLVFLGDLVHAGWMGASVKPVFWVGHQRIALLVITEIS